MHQPLSDYVLKDFIEISESNELYCYGYRVATFVEDEFVKSYHKKHREQCNRRYAENRKKPVSKPKPKLMPAEKRERCRQRAHEYYCKEQRELSHLQAQMVS